MSNQTSSERSCTRRDFVKTAAAASIAAAFPASFGVFAQGSDTFKVGVIGCGGRGTGAAIDCLKRRPRGRDRRPRRPRPRPRRELAARADEGVPGPGEGAARTRFTGFDNYQRRLRRARRSTSSSPPRRRASARSTSKAAIEAGKHVFMEKPVAVDPAGVRSVIAAGRAGRSRRSWRSSPARSAATRSATSRR